MRSRRLSLRQKQPLGQQAPLAQNALVAPANSCNDQRHWLAVALALLGGCRAGEVAPLTCPADSLASLFCPGQSQDDSSEYSEDAGTTFVPIPWGVYAATLPVPSCPAGETPLVVDTTDDAIDSSALEPTRTGPTLSFPEALLIAMRATTPSTKTTITFSADVFPVRAPGVIRLSGREPTQFYGLPNTCIDARNRGVIIEWAPECELCTWSLGAGSLQVGLTLRSMLRALELRENSQMSGCFLDANFPSVEVAGGTLGPGNVLAGALGATMRGDHSAIIDNFFGYDPATHTRLKPQVGLRMAGALDQRVLNNTFYSTTALQFVDPSTPRELMLQGNVFEGNVGTFSSGTVVFAGNVVKRGGGIIITGESTRVRITRNSITGPGLWNPYRQVAPVAPPTITKVLADSVRGTCSVSGLIELFTDPADKGEQFLGDVQCEAGLEWELVTSVPATGFVTATLTDSQQRTSAFSQPVATR